MSCSTLNPDFTRKINYKYIVQRTNKYIRNNKYIDSGRNAEIY